MTTLTPVSFKNARAHEPRLSAPPVIGRQHARFWKDHELQVVRDHYASGGVAGCLARLPGRTPSGVYAVAKRFGLKSENRPETRLRHDYGPEMDARIQAAWPELRGRDAVNGLADRLCVPRWWLSKRATVLGLSKPHRREPEWTEVELALMHKVPLHDPHRCAEIFRDHGYNRTPTAIVVRAKRLEISRRTHETLSARGAARILGVDDKAVTGWCIAGDLKAGRRGSKRLPQQGGDAWAIEPAELRRFILVNLGFIDIRKVDKLAFVALIAEGGGVGKPSDAARPKAAGQDVTVELCTRIAELEQQNRELRSGLSEARVPRAAAVQRPIRRWVRQVPDSAQISRKRGRA